MRFSVLTETRNIRQLVNPDQIDNLAINIDELVYEELLIQNLGETNIYLEVRGEASVEDSFRIQPNEVLEINQKNLAHLNLISEGEENDNVRLINN